MIKKWHKTFVDIEVESNVDSALSFLKGLGPKADIATKRSLKRSLNGMPIDAFGALKGHYNVKKAFVRESFSSSIRGNPPVGRGTFSGPGSFAYNFSPRPSKVTRRRPPVGVSIMIKQQRKIIAGSFVARMRSGHIGLFARRGKPRLPIDEIYTSAIAQMLDNPEVRERIQEKAAERFEKNLAHEIEFALQQEAR